MAKVKYVGSMDSRGLSAADFKKLGVEEGAKKMVFLKGEEVEVDQPLADALMHETLLAGEFEIVEDTTEVGDGATDTADGGTETELTDAQKAKVAKAAKAGTAAAKKSEALPAEAEVAQDGHPQETASPDQPSTTR